MTTLDDSFWLDLDELKADAPEEEDHREADDGDVDMEDLNPKRYGDMESIEEIVGLCLEIEKEIAVIDNFVCDNYRSKFPELESVVHHPVDYARVVRKIGNQMDLSVIDLRGLLPSAIIMVVSVTASTTNGKPLPGNVLEKTMEACDQMIQPDSAKKKLTDFFERRMVSIAPNLSAIVGTSVAAKLMVSAGGLSSLAEMPACNFCLLGANKNVLYAKLSSRFGYIEEADIFQRTPPSLRGRVCRVLSSKSALATRIDYLSGDTTGKRGRDLHQEICKKIEGWQQPRPVKLPKALPGLNLVKMKKRGGRRMRKMKERYATTDVYKKLNRMQFGVPASTEFLQLIKIINYNVLIQDKRFLYFDFRVKNKGI